VWADYDESPEGLSFTDVHTGIFGVGATVSDALEDFVAALVGHARVLAEEEACIDADLKRHLAYLRRHVMLA
jgi:hypothetical protein